MAWVIEQYGTAVATFLAGLTATDREKITILIKRLAEVGNAMHMPQSKNLGENLYELRTKSGVRVFYTFRGARIILLGGIIKKRDELPNAVVALMRTRSKAVL